MLSEGSSLPPPAGPSQSRPVHACTYCGKSFSRTAKLQAHLLIHTDSRPHTCSHQGCGAAYRTKDKLTAHQKKAHLSPKEQEEYKRFVCSHDRCGRRFWTNQHLLRHIEGVHDAGATDLEREKGEDEASGSAARYECTEGGCTHAFSKRKRLRRHIWEAHTDHQAGSQEDGNGEQKEGSDFSLKNRLPFSCQYSGCSKRFPTNSKRKAHFKTHDQQDRYTCALPHPSCSPSSDGLLVFPTWSALQSHMRLVHPPACHYPACAGRIFKNKDNLKMHLRRHEERAHSEKERLRTAEGAFSEGEWCEVSGDEESAAEEEEDSNSGARRSLSLRTFNCTWRPEPPTSDEAAPCMKSFKSSHALQTHIRIAHLKERPFSCICGKSYGHKHLLKRHEVKCPSLPSLRDNADGDDKDSRLDRKAQSELEEEEEDELFRSGGGALPEQLRETGTIATTTNASARGSLISRRAKRKRRDEYWDLEEAATENEASMVDLLTGRGYACPVSRPNGQSNSDGCASQNQVTSKTLPSPGSSSRAKRPRILPCPWSRLPDWHSPTKAGATTEGDSPQDVQGGNCPFRFSRLYDVTRHLKGEHGVPLSQGQVRLLFTEEEVRGLPEPRRSSRSTPRCGEGEA